MNQTFIDYSSTTDTELPNQRESVEVLPKAELKAVVKRLLLDKKKVIPSKLFAQLCGLSRYHLHETFVLETRPISEVVQRRVSRAYCLWRDGKVRVMVHYGRKYLEFREEPKPIATRGYGLKMTSEGIKLKIGIKNKFDYSDYRLDETMKGR
jgi:hypothetical protein